MRKYEQLNSDVEKNAKWENNIKIQMQALRQTYPLSLPQKYMYVPVYIYIYVCVRFSLHTNAQMAKG